MPNSTPETENAPTRIETPTHVVHLMPRISAAKLAEYVVADPSRQSAIAKAAKNSPKAITPQYHRVRGTFQHAHGLNGLNPTYFLERAAQVEVAPAANSWHQGDNERSALALKNLAEIADQIECGSATIIHGKWQPLKIQGAQ